MSQAIVTNSTPDAGAGSRGAAVTLLCFDIRLICERRSLRRLRFCPRALWRRRTGALVRSGIYSRPDSVDRSGLHPERMTGTPANAALNASSAVRPCSAPVAITLAAAA
jgi:hypothetical protein